MFRDLRPSPKAFVPEAIRLLGGEWEESDDGVTFVLLPGESDLRQVTFEPEVAREEKGIELVAYGSPLMELLTDVGLRQGRLARAFAEPPRKRPPDLDRAYRLEVDRWERTEWAERSWTTWVFVIGATCEGEFRRDELYVAAVDARSLRLVRRFEEPFSSLMLGQERPEPSTEKSFEECYAVARRELVSRALQGFRAARRESEGLLKGDLARLGRYYQDLMEEMRQDAARLEADDPRRTGILSRIEAVKIEHARSMAQSRERYRVTLEVEAVGALGMIYSRWVAPVSLFDKKGRGVMFEAAWDPVLEQFEPTDCPACRRPTYRLALEGGIASCGCRR